MDKVHYAGSSFLTGTAIARALLDYAQALGQAGASDTVDVPTLNEDGTQGRSEVLIGPASQILSAVEKSEYADVTDQNLVSHMQKEAAAVRAHGPSTVTAGIRYAQPRQDLSDFDY